MDVAVGSVNANPYGLYRWLRKNAPIAYAPALDGLWLVSRWDDVVAVLKADEIYSSRVEPADMADFLGGNLLFTDGRRHARLRASMQAPCQPRRAQAFAEETAVETADELVDVFEPAGEAELVEEFFGELASRLVARVIGIDDVDPVELRRWFDDISRPFLGEVPPPRAAESDAKIEAAMRRHLDRIAERPSDSLLSSMRHWHDDEGPLSERELLVNAKVFAAAGVHELSDLMAHTLLGLLSRPDQLDEVRADPSLAKAAIEEGARWASPVGMVPRRSSSDTELGGQRIPKGTFLAVLLASANRDERRWTDPNRFDLHRDEGMHVAYASGEHFCLGAWIARAVGAAALGRLVQRLPELELGGRSGLTVTGWRFREVRRLSVTWA